MSILRPDFLYASLDIETDGTTPGINNMLSLAAVLYSHEGLEVAHFNCNLEPADGLKPDYDCMLDFWAHQPIAWAKARSWADEPQFVMKAFVEWLDLWIGGDRATSTIIPVCWPANFDYPFIDYYCQRFVGKNSLSRHAIDIHSLWEGAGCPFTIDLDNPHIAIEDARNQGALFFKVAKHIDARPWRRKT